MQAASYRVAAAPALGNGRAHTPKLLPFDRSCRSSLPRTAPLGRFKTTARPSRLAHLPRFPAIHVNASSSCAGAPLDEATGLTWMEYGGITPFGLPRGWPVLVDKRVYDTPWVVVGSGLRRSKLRVPGPLLAELPGAEVLSLTR